MAVKRKQQYRHSPAFILLELAEGQIHYGAIHFVLSEKLPSFIADTAAVYRTLRHLEQRGEVVSTWDRSCADPTSKIYHLTTLGWKKLDYWKQDIEQRLLNLHHFLTQQYFLTACLHFKQN